MCKEPPFVVVDVSEAVTSALLDFFKGLGRKIDKLDGDSDLIDDTGATSDEGVDFAIDLSDKLGFEIPHTFNPFVHPSGRRGMRLRELIEHATRFACDAKEARHGE